MFLVTGGAGFIGSNVVASLNEAGASDVVVNDLLGKDDAKWRNLAKRQVADIVPPAELMSWLHGRKLEAVIHLGAISDTTATDGDLMMENNFRTSLRLLDWCTVTRTPFIYASSAATYGDGAEGFTDDWSLEALRKLKPMNLYGWSKHLFDRWVARELAESHARPSQWVGLKFFNVYGPNEYHKGGMQSVVAQKYPLAVAGEPLTLFRSHRSDVPDGGQKRDFVYVADCVDVMLWLLEHPEVNGLFNLGTGHARSFDDLARAMFTALQQPPNITYIDTPLAIRPNYQYFTEASMERLRQAGYTKPFTSLADGVREYIGRYLSQPDRYR